MRPFPDMVSIGFRSFENNFEGNMFFYDAAVAQRFKAVFLDDEAQATPLNSLPSLMHPNIARRLWDSLNRLLSPLL